MLLDVELDVIIIADNCTDWTDWMEEMALRAGAEFNLELKVLTTINNK